MTAKRGGDDCPACFGDANSCGHLPACHTCPYKDACRFYADNPAPASHERDKRGHHVSLEHFAFARDVAAPDAPFFDEPAEAADDYNRPMYSNADMQRLLEFMLRVDDYSLAIIECVLRDGHTTASQVARAFNVSREAMHRKLLDSCKRYPYLAEMLRGMLYRCRVLAEPSQRGRIVGRRKRADAGEEKKQMEFTF